MVDWTGAQLYKSADGGSTYTAVLSSVVPATIGAFYILFGAAAFVYARDPFWLFFLLQGVMLLGATLGLRGQTSTA